MSFALTVHAQWEKSKSEDGIDIYTRPIEGTNFKEFKGVGVIDAPLAEVDAVLSDIPHLADWMPDCRESRILEEIDEGHMIIYQILEMPFVFKDRDYTVEMIVSRTPERIVRTMKAVPHPSMPEQENLVRITDLQGTWIIEAYGPEGNRSKVEYRIKTDPAGNAPAFMVNSVSVNIPLETIQRLRDQVTDRY